MRKYIQQVFFLIDVAFALLVSVLIAMVFVSAEIAATQGKMLPLDISDSGY